MASWNFALGKTAKGDLETELAKLHPDHKNVSMDNDRAETANGAERSAHRDNPDFQKDFEAAKKAILDLAVCIDDPFVIASASGHVPEGSAGVDGVAVSISGHKE